MKIKREYVILAVILIALVMYLVVHGSDRNRYQLPSMPEVEKESISKIEIFKSGASVELNRKDKKWYIGPKEYPADETKIDNMLRLIGTVTHTALVSESKNYKRYDLDDDSRIEIKAWAGEKLVRHLEIGKEASTYSHTFVKLPGDFRVYQTEGNYRSKFEDGVDELRDKVIMSFDKGEIRKIEAFKDRKWVVLTRIEEKNSKETVWGYGNGKRADSEKIGELLNILSDMRGEKYIEDRKKEDLKDPVYVYRMTGKREYTLSIFAKGNQDSKQYPSLSSENDYPFMLHEYDVDRMKDKLESEENPSGSQ